MLIIPLHNTISDQELEDHVLTLCVLVPNPEVELKRLPFFYISIPVALVTFISVMLLAWFCTFTATSRMIKPLRHLNDRMIEIMEEGNEGTAEINIG